MMLTRSFSKNISPQLIDSARLDNCGEWRFLFKIAIPMVAPTIIVIAMFYTVSYWNSYFEAMIYITDQDKLPLANVMRNILILNQGNITQWNTNVEANSAISAIEKAKLMEYALIIVASLPMMIISIVTNRYSENEKFKTD